MTITQPITVPELTREQALILIYWYEAGKDTDNHQVDWVPAMQAIQHRYGFAAWDAATRLREQMHPALLGRFGLEQPFSDQLILHPVLREHPELIWQRLNEAEAREKRAITPMPDFSQDVTRPAGVAPMVVPSLQVGQLVNTPDGPAEIVLKDGRPAYRLLAAVHEPTAEEVARAAMPRYRSKRITKKKAKKSKVG